MTTGKIVKTNIEFESAFDIFCTLALKYKAGIAIWRLPNKKIRHILLSTEYSALSDLSNLSVASKGFLFHPYIKKSDDTPAVFLKANIIYSEERKSIEIISEHTRSNIYNSILEDLSNGVLNYAKTCTTEHLQLQDNIDNDRTGKERFKQTVEKTVEKINSGAIDKVVISLQEVMNLTKPLQLREVYTDMCSKYPAGFVSFVFLPNVGTWMGVSPELFLNISSDNVAQTVALAGTMNKNKYAGKVDSWSNKELKEHLFVSDYIENCLKQAGVENVDKSGLLAQVAGELIHLKTEFKFLFSPEKHNLSSFLESLHPTPATCGVPLKEANNYILDNEPFSRKYYCGFLGSIGIDNEVNLFVNLRCAELFNKHIVFYAGAGITAQSNPNEEWDEVQLKCRTMYNVMSSYLDVSKSELIVV